MASSSNNSSNEPDWIQHDFPFQIWFSKPNAEIVYKSLLLLPIILCGVIGNLLLLNVVFRNRALHTPTNYILANMIAADTLTIFLCPAVFICSDFFQNFILGPVGCKMDGFLQVSYDRLTAIVLPMEKRITMRGAKMTMLFTWLAGLTISIPFAVYRNYKERKWKNFVEKFCMENMTVLPLYWNIILMLLVLCPLCVMIICYSAIFWKLDRYEQKVLKRENSITISYKTKVARMLFIIVGIFVLLHIPFTVLIFMRTKLIKRAVMNQLEGGFYLLSCISHYCLFLNSAINPIIYGLTNDNFRRAYHQTPIIPKHFGRLLHALKQLKYKRHLMVEKQNVDVQPIIYRLTQETVPNPATIKSAAYLSQQTVPPNINDNDTSTATTTVIAATTNNVK
ncbi:neuropeptide FF receptor 2 isoform X2 [Sitodiplosis mosellana]|uniref:neuropeptide FF receptor 2 isoform X2 n=1 Tax=Sitodiplosis mosellana TaxID=263140 RepID=UPI002443F686|nr:neuropeptide FF receptor 2 isoform X2 [Sitodiplosis mosellana]